MQCARLKTYMETGRVVFLPARAIRPNPAQPRKLFREEALAELEPQTAVPVVPTLAGAEQVLSIRNAFMMPSEQVDLSRAKGRICGCPAVACPPAVPVVVAGERISEEAVAVFRYYGIEKAEVLVNI